MGTVRDTYGKLDKTHATIYSENLKGRDHLGDLGIDTGIILKQILKNMF
jgi:hypothetical protein